MVVGKYPMVGFTGGSRGSVFRSFASLEDKFGGCQQEEKISQRGRRQEKNSLYPAGSPNAINASSDTGIHTGKFP